MFAELLTGLDEMRLLVFSTCVMQRSRFLSCKLFVWYSLGSA